MTTIVQLDCARQVAASGSGPDTRARGLLREHARETRRGATSPETAPQCLASGSQREFREERGFGVVRIYQKGEVGRMPHGLPTDPAEALDPRFAWEHPIAVQAGEMANA